MLAQMPVTKIGIIYYSDDPHKRVFRVVYPTNDDSELDAPCPDILDTSGQPVHWTDFNVDDSRPRVLEKIAKSDTTVRFHGTPNTPANEPIVYFINIDLLARSLTEDQAQALQDWVAFHPKWSNFVDLGIGTPSILAANINIISPAWIVVVGGGNPGVGVLQRQTTINGRSLALWIV
jgi:hypothetical protein